MRGGTTAGGNRDRISRGVEAAEPWNGVKMLLRGIGVIITGRKGGTGEGMERKLKVRATKGQGRGGQRPIFHFAILMTVFRDGLKERIQGEKGGRDRKEERAPQQITCQRL